MKAVKRSSTRRAIAPTQLAARGKRLVPPTASRPASKKPADSSPRQFVRLRSRGKGAGKKARVQIPAILLEGDEPGSVSPPTPTSPRSGPGAPVVPPSATDVLPEAYGTQRLKLTARDPNWIHAHWDFTRDQLRQVRARAEGGPLVLRLFQQSTQGPLVSETRVHPESVRWLLHTPEPHVPCVAEIGFYDKHHRWSTLAESNAVRTPPAGPSGDRGFELATLAADGSIRRHGTIKEWSRPPGLAASATWWRDPGSSVEAAAGSSSPTLPSGLPSESLASPGIHAWSSLDSSI